MATCLYHRGRRAPYGRRRLRTRGVRWYVGDHWLYGHNGVRTCQWRYSSHQSCSGGQWPGGLSVLERTVQPDDDSAEALRVPDGILLLSDGTLLVADAKPAEVMRFDATGKYVGSIGREGAGPGEYRAPWLAALGDTLVVHDPTLGRAVMFSLATGASITQRRTTPRYYGKIGINGFRQAVAPMMIDSDSTTGPRSAFVRFSLDGNSMDTAYLPEHPRGDTRWIVREGPNPKFEMQVPLQPKDVHAVDPLGGFVTGWSGEFVLRTTRDGRDTVRLISRPERGSDVSAKEKVAIVEEKIVAMKGQAAVEALRAGMLSSAIPDRRPAFEQLRVDGAGRIWAQRSPTVSTLMLFDLFDRDGRWLDVLSINASGWNTGWWKPASFANDHVAVLIEDDDGRPAVLVYRLVRGAVAGK